MKRGRGVAEAILIVLCTPLEVTAVLVDYAEHLGILLGQSEWPCTSLSLKQSASSPLATKLRFARCICGCPCAEM